MPMTHIDADQARAMFPNVKGPKFEACCRRYGLDTVLSPWNVNAASSDNRGNSFTGAAYAAL